MRFVKPCSSALVFLLACGMLSAQENADGVAIKVNVSLVNVSFTVRDQAGKLAADLKADDFEVLEDGVARPIKFFGRASDLPLRLALLVDGSGSQQKFNRQHHKDLQEFLSSALTARDRAFLVGFATHIRLASDMTSESAMLVDALTRYEKSSHGMPELDADNTREGGTALFDAVCAAAAKLGGFESERKAILLLSDGEDNASGHDLIEAIEAAQNAGVVIYAIRYTQPRKDGGLSARNRYGITEMSRLAKDTGGATFDASKGSVAESLAQVAEELRSMYELGYAGSPERDGTFRKLVIRSKITGLTIRAKSGYYAK